LFRSRIGRRFDHAFCSPEFKILRCEYLHEVRERNLSDHSALELEFALRAAPGPLAGLFSSSSFGLTLGAFNHRSIALRGTSWVIGGSWTSMWSVAFG